MFSLTIELRRWGAAGGQNDGGEVTQTEGQMPALRQRAERAAVLRLTAILEGEEVSAADAIKAASLVLDKLQTDREEEDGGMFEVTVV